MKLKTDLSFVERTASRVEHQRLNTSGVFQLRNRAFIETFSYVSLQIAKAKMKLTVAEKLILPFVKDINCILSGKETQSKWNILSRLTQCKVGFH